MVHLVEILSCDWLIVLQGFLERNGGKNLTWARSYTNERTRDGATGALGKYQKNSYPIFAYSGKKQRNLLQASKKKKKIAQSF